MSPQTIKKRRVSDNLNSLVRSSLTGREMAKAFWSGYCPVMAVIGTILCTISWIKLLMGN